MENKRFSLKDVGIAKKLVFSHGLIICFAVVIIITCVFGMTTISSYLSGLYEGPMTSVDVVGDLLYGASDMQRTMLWSILKEDERDYSEFEREVQTNVELMSSSIATMKGSLINESNKKLLSEIENCMASASSLRTEIMDDIKVGRYTEATNSYLQYSEYINEIKSIAEELNEEIRATGLEYEDNALRVSITLIIVAVALLVVSFIASVYIVRSIIHMIVEPVKQLMDVAEEMHEGNMHGVGKLTYESKDELGQLADSMRKTMNNLSAYVDEISDNLRVIATGDLTKSSDSITDFRGEFLDIKKSLVLILKRFNSTLVEIRSVAGEVNSGADQIASGSQVLAQGAGEQAASVEELSATVNGISEEVKTNAANAADALDRVTVTTGQMNECDKKMKEMMVAMNDITEKSVEISKIVKTIEDIAFQTNILALNAAVEAARAGEAGKGFAVVADEVRNLAGKSAEASKSTSDLIGGTVDAVNKGTKVLDDTAADLQKAVEGADAIFGIVQGIAQAAAREADALSQVDTGIEQVAGVVQTTSSTAEESAAASEELSGQASVLQSLLERFKLFSEQGSVRSTVTPVVSRPVSAPKASPVSRPIMDGGNDKY